MAIAMELPIGARFRQLLSSRENIGGWSDGIFPTMQQEDAGIDLRLTTKFRRN